MPAFLPNDETRNNLPNSVLVGKIYDFRVDQDDDRGYKRSLIASKDILSAQEDVSSSSYDDRCMMSLDGLFRPVSLDGSGGLPPMAQAKSEAVYDPESSSNVITNKYLNFLANPSGEDPEPLDHSELAFLHDGEAGHDIDIIARRDYQFYNDSLGSNKTYGMTMPTNVEYQEPSGENPASTTLFTDYSDDYRFMALRGPLYIHGWGYDTDGKPIPNAQDTESNAAQGVFEDENLSNKFLDDWLKKPHTWPAAPVDMRFDRERGVWAATGGGGGGGNNSRQVLLVDDLQGYAWDNMRASPIASRYINIEFENDTAPQYIIDDKSEFVDAFPTSGVPVSMSASECCESSGGGSRPAAGLAIDDEISGNLITDAEASGLVISGSGVFSDSTVAVVVTDGSSNITASTVVVLANGQWSTEALDITGLSGGLLRIDARETYSDTTQQAIRRASIQYSKGHNTSALNYAPPVPNPPNMSAASDEGASSSDNKTANTQPDFDVTTTVPGSATGPAVRLIIDGAVVHFRDEVDAGSAYGAVGSSIVLTPTSPLSLGDHRVQCQLLLVDSSTSFGQTVFPSAVSRPIYIRIDQNEAGQGQTITIPTGDLFGRTAWATERDGVWFIDDVDKCPIRLSAYLSDRVNNLITARALATTGGATVSVDGSSFVLDNPTTQADPTPPTSIDDNGLTVNSGDLLKMRYFNGQWELRGVE